MKIQLIAPGYTAFTGVLSGVAFTNGISDSTVSDERAAFFGAIYGVERLDVDAAEIAEDAAELAVAAAHEAAALADAAAAAAVHEAAAIAAALAAV